MTQREERMKLHLYSNEGRVEQCERICSLEELALNMRRDFYAAYSFGTMHASAALSDLLEQYEGALGELGIEVPHGD